MTGKMCIDSNDSRRWAQWGRCQLWLWAPMPEFWNRNLTPPWPRQKSKSAAVQYQFVAQQMGVLLRAPKELATYFSSVVPTFVILRKINTLLEGWVFVIRRTCCYCHTQQALRNIGAILDHLGTVTPTARATLHLCSAICTKQFYTVCRSPSIDACLKQILLQLFSHLDTSAKLRKATISFVMSVCPPVCPHGTTRFILDGLIFGYFSKIWREKFQFHSNLPRITATLHED
jgi:hypothetical protein